MGKDQRPLAGTLLLRDGGQVIDDIFAPPDDPEIVVAPAGRLRLEPVSALLGEPEPDLAWLIEGLWTDKSRGLIAGHPGVGKTWLALDMLLAVSTGGLCLGKYRTAGPAPCMLIEEEASRLNLARRVHALARARGLRDSDLSNLFHITRQFAKVPRDTLEIASIVKEHGIKLVVFDSLRRFHSAKENSSDEMQVVLDSFAKIGEVGGCSVVLIHHLSKAGKEEGRKPLFERMRGTGDLWAWRDCIIGVEGEEDADTATCSFQFRDAETPGPIRIKRAVNGDSGAISMAAIPMEESEEFQEKSQAVLVYMKTQYGAVTRNQICDKVAGRKGDILKVLKQMEKAGMLAKEGGKLVVPETAGTNGN